MKKIISVLLAMILAFSALAVCASADSEYQTYHISFEISNETSLTGETNLKIVPLEGYNTYVLAGEDFKFVIETSEDFSNTFTIVHSNGIKIEPDIHGVYTISDIHEDQAVRVSFSIEETQSNMFASLIVLVRGLLETILNAFRQLFNMA